MKYELIDIVLRAGDILIDGLNNNLKPTYKGKADIVTEIDIKSEKFLKEHLTKLYPDYLIIAEETNNVFTDSIYSKKIIYIDPLDGTTNYFHKFPFFAVSVALYNGFIPEIGLVYAPYYKELFYSEKGQGSFLNGRRISVSTRKDINDSLIVTGFSYDAFREKNIKSPLEIFRNVSLNSHGVRRIGSAALDLCYVAKGVFEGFYEKSLKPWDIAAGKLIVEEAGGKVTDELGNNHNFESSYIVATNNYIHENLLEFINYND